MKTFEKKLTLSMPCFMRPQRTIRAINCIATQSMDNWEARIVGDGCPVIQDFLDSNYFSDLIADCKKRGNDLMISNNQKRQGGHGYAITNANIAAAKGEYFAFFANDDIITTDHFDNYLAEIDGTDYDFIYFDSFVNPRNAPRISALQYGMIGHSELIVRTKFLQSMPMHGHDYGHDWELIYAMSLAGKHKKANSTLQTYNVMSLSDNRETEID